MDLPIRGYAGLRETNPPGGSKPALGIDNAQFIRNFLGELSGKPKPDEVIDQYVSVERLKQHIRWAESVAPSYELIADQLVSEGDMVALRGTVRGIHRGDFNGLPPTGKPFTADVAVFYRIADGKIVDLSIVFDALGALNQLKG